MKSSAQPVSFHRNWWTGAYVNRTDFPLVLLVALAIATDAFAAGRVHLIIGPAYVTALLVARPRLGRAALATAFFSFWAALMPAFGLPGAGLSAAVQTGMIIVAARTLGWWLDDGSTIGSARKFVEVMVIGALSVPLLMALAASVLVRFGEAFAGLASLMNLGNTILGAAVVLPVVLLAYNRTSARPLPRALRLARFCVVAVVATVVALLAEVHFPYPFIVACIPLIVAAIWLSPFETALLSALCMVEMTASVVSPQFIRPNITFEMRAVAAVLTGVLPIGLALLVAELRSERARLVDTGSRLKQILASIEGYGFCTLDRLGYVVAWNDQIGELMCLPSDQAIGSHFSRFLAAEDRRNGASSQLLEQAAEYGRADSAGWRTKGDGALFWAMMTVEAIRNPVGQVTGFMLTLHDQTELQQSQSALMAAERRWGFALGSSGQGVWEYDRLTRHAQFSQVYAAMLGMTEEELGHDPTTWKALVHPDDIALVPTIEAEDTLGEVEFRLRHASGRWIWVSDRRRVAERDETGRPIRLIGVHTDITDRKLAEEKFRLAVEASPNGLMIADASGRITLANSETERMFGYEPGTLLGCRIDVLVPDDHRSGHAALRAGYAAHPTARRMGHGRELFGRRQDGTLFPVEIGLNPINTTEGAQVLCAVTDITSRKRAEVELALSEERFRTMADHFTDLVVHLDLDFECVWVSKASMDILGIPPEEMNEFLKNDGVHPDDTGLRRQALVQVASGVDRSRFTGRYRHVDGHWVWLDVVVRLTRDSDGAPAGILTVARDVTRARAAEDALKASEATFRGAMAGAAIGMALEDMSGHWRAVNPALCAIFGRGEAELVGMASDLFVLSDDKAIDSEDRARLIAGEIASYQVEKRCLGRSGAIIWTQQSISLDRALDGRPRSLILLIQDVTERRQIEQMKSEFISMVSHELRTPLTSIRGALGLVLGAMAKDLPPRVVNLVDIAHKNSERLIPLVNDILDLDKIASGLLRIEAVETDVSQLVIQAADTTRSFAERFGATLSIQGADAPVRAVVDEGRFIQVLTNLISNAAKFSPSGSAVDIGLAVNGNRVRVSVEDRGPGIPDEFRPRIFGRFAQADSATTRSKGGSGLGLHISKQLVSLMGGDIGFESTLGQGSVFWVEFPLAGAERVRLSRRMPALSASQLHSPQADATPDVPDAELDSDLPRVLHIEDDTDFASVLEAGLAGQAVVYNAGSVGQAKATLEKRTFDLAIIDPLLPDGDGVTLLVPLLERLGIPFIVLSANEVTERRRGALSHIVKSRISEPQLVSKIASLLPDRRHVPEEANHGG